MAPVAMMATATTIQTSGRRQGGRFFAWGRGGSVCPGLEDTDGCDLGGGVLMRWRTPAWLRDGVLGGDVVGRAWSWCRGVDVAPT